MRSSFLTLALGAILTLGTITEARAGDPWTWIEAIELEEVEKNGEWQVKKGYPPELKANAKNFRITGYYVPVVAQSQVKEFLIVPDPADCPFCGSGGYGLTLEVHMKRAIPDMAEATKVTLQGRLDFIDDPETYQAVILRDAKLVGEG